MKLKAVKTPYSSVVGGGFSLVDYKGRARFQVVVMGTTNGITKEQDAEICEKLIAAFNTGEPHE